MKVTATHVYFWGSVFSQWYISEFEEDGITFSSAEQYMMYKKAMLFGDTEIAKQILAEDDPSECKSLGRKVKNYNEDVWVQNRLDIVVQGNYLKFTQNPKLKKEMLNTLNRTFVEGSPKDRIWGVGLHYNDVKIIDSANWDGLNLLGKALDIVKSRIRNNP